MTKNILKYIFFVVLTVSISCCSSKKNKTADSPESHYPSSIYTFDTTGHANNIEDNPQFNYSYELNLPNEGISACADSIRLSIITSATDVKSLNLDSARAIKVNAMMQKEEDEAKSFKEMFGATDTPWTFNCNSGCVYEDNDIYNSIFKFSSYEGGAHGFHCGKFEIWDKANAKRVSFHDIFVEDSEEALSTMIVDSLCKMMNVKKPEDLTETGILDVKDIHPNNNISVDNESLTFNYIPYEIAAYAVGEIGVRFSFEDIKPLMKTDSPIYKFAE